MKQLFLLLLATATSLCAQEFRGTFSGTVTDATGAAVPKAKIIATEVQTGLKTTVYSEASGAYTIPFLAPGHYDISAEATGSRLPSAGASHWKPAPARPSISGWKSAR